MRAACYARVSTRDQKTLSAQVKIINSYAKKRRWKLVTVIKEIGSGAEKRKSRDELLRAALRREIDVIIVWRLDRWGRSIVDLISTLKDLRDTGVGFVSITESLDLTTASGRAFVGMLSVFAEFERDLLSERIKAGIIEARGNGGKHGRPITVGNQTDQIKKLFKNGISKSEIARHLKIGRTSVRRLLQS